MAKNIGAVGICGIAFETTPGTFVPPTKFGPIMSESLTYKQDTKYRRSIRAIADAHGAIPGNAWVTGDITFEVTEDFLVYWLYASRCSVAKTGATNFVYTTTPTHNATGPTKPALSIAIQRNAQTFGYTGCVVTGIEFTIDAMVLMCKVSVMGFDEATAANPTPTWPTATPYGAGTYTLSIGGVQVTDADTITFTIDEGAEALFRLNTVRSANLIKWGERAVTAKLDRDFDSRADYDAFKAYTAQAIDLVASKGINNSVEFKAAASIKDSNEINLSGQGDLVRASIAYTGIYDTATSKAWECIVKTQEAIT